MKNIQVIDGADNCTYNIYQISENDFKLIFTNPEQNIEFIEDLIERLGEHKIKDLNSRLWRKRILKEKVLGIHGTLFYQLHLKKKYYPLKVDQQN